MILCSSALSKWLSETGHLLGFAVQSLPFCVDNPQCSLSMPSPHPPPFHHLTPLIFPQPQVDVVGMGEGRMGTLKLCQNGAKAENATAHQYNVVDMRDSERGREVSLNPNGAGERLIRVLISPSSDSLWIGGGGGGGGGGVFDLPPVQLTFRDAYSISNCTNGFKQKLVRNDLNSSLQDVHVDMMMGLGPRVGRSALILSPVLAHPCKLLAPLALPERAFEANWGLDFGRFSMG